MARGLTKYLPVTRIPAHSEEIPLNMSLKYFDILFISSKFQVQSFKFQVQNIQLFLYIHN